MAFIINNQTKRLYNILNVFERFTTCTLKTLSSETATSDRTLLRDIQVIKTYFEESIAITSTISGYHFSVVDKTLFIEKKQKLIEDEPLFKLIESIFYNQCLSLSEWADTLHLSESSLVRYLKCIQPVLDDYEISVLTNPLDFSGKEINIRRFFYDFYYESDITSHTMFPSLAVYHLTLVFRKSKFFEEFAHISFNDFKYTLHITIERFINGKTIDELPKEINFLKKKIPIYYCANVKHNMVKYFGTDLSETEKLYLYAILLSKRSLMSICSEVAFLEKLPLKRQALQWAEAYMLIAAPPISEKERSLVFFESFFSNLLFVYQLSPVLNQNLTENSYLIEQYSVNTYKKTYSFIQQNISPILDLNEKQTKDISANLSVYLDSMRIMYWKTTKNIAFFLEGNRYICENIRAMAIKSVGKYHNLYFPDATDMTPEYFEDNEISIVITNYSHYVSEYLYECTHLLFEPYPTHKDWQRLFVLLNPKAKLVFSDFLFET
nr:helix-turn-helix domain-containing protein [Marinilactibacillus kalidii]